MLILLMRNFVNLGLIKKYLQKKQNKKITILKSQRQKKVKIQIKKGIIPISQTLPWQQDHPAKARVIARSQAKCDTLKDWEKTITNESCPTENRRHQWVVIRPALVSRRQGNDSESLTSPSYLHEFSQRDRNTSLLVSASPCLPYQTSGGKQHTTAHLKMEDESQLGLWRPPRVETRVGHSDGRVAVLLWQTRGGRFPQQRHF